MNAVSESRFPPASFYEHGTRARYVAGCRCDKCKKVNRDIYHELQRRSIEAALELEPLPPVPVTRKWRAPDGTIKTRTYNKGCPGVNGKPCETESFLRKDSIAGICATCRSKLVWNGLVSADLARAHLHWLSRHGVGHRAVAAASDVADTIIQQIKAGKKQIRASTEKAILAVDLSCHSDKGYVDAKPVRKMGKEIRSFGIHDAEIIRRLGRKGYGLYLNRKKVTAKTAHKIEKFLNELRETHKSGINVNALPDYALVDVRPVLRMVRELHRLGITNAEICERLGVKNRSKLFAKPRVQVRSYRRIEKLLKEARKIHEMGKKVARICTHCGYSHKPADRQRLIKRMVLEGLTTKQIKAAYTCFYPNNDAGERLVYRDISAILDQERKGRESNPQGR